MDRFHARDVLKQVMGALGKIEFREVCALVFDDDRHKLLPLSLVEVLHSVPMIVCGLGTIPCFPRQGNGVELTFLFASSMA